MIPQLSNYLMSIQRDIFQQQSMQNWKKEIIMDPHLSSLFDTNLPAQQFVTAKIQGLSQEQKVKIYMKLTGLRHAISKGMQSEIEIRSEKIEECFQRNYQTKSSYEAINHEALTTNIKQIQKFNEKYEFVAEKVVQNRNINKILHFARALEKFKVSLRMLKSLMKDYDQLSANKHLGELVNTLKISKLLKQISAITLKFDFTGIQSFEVERGFINHAKGAIFGLIQRQLSAALLKIPKESGVKKEELEKEISNKLAVLANLNKLKDFCVPFFKNIVKQVSELLKKNLVTSQGDDVKQLSVFEDSFSSNVRRKIVECSMIFVTLQELLEKSNTRTTFIANFFEKYWENLIGFVRDLLTWSIDNDTKQCNKQKYDNLFDAFSQSDVKTGSRYLSCLHWKYPALIEQLASTANEVHLYLLTHTHYHHYSFVQMKEMLMKELLPLSQLYYRQITAFYAHWQARMNKFKNEGVKDAAELFNGVEIYERSLQWLLGGLKTEEIYEYHIDSVIEITDLYFSFGKSFIERYDSQIDTRNVSQLLFKNLKAFIYRSRDILRRSKQSDENSKVITADPQKLIVLIRKYRGYFAWFKQVEPLLNK